MNQEGKVREIRRRSGILRKRHDRGIAWILSASSAAVMFLLVSACAYLSREHTGPRVGNTYGAMLGGSDIGGYVLAAVIAFTAGVIVTATLMRYGKRRTAGKDAAVDEEKEERT